MISMPETTSVIATTKLSGYMGVATLFIYLDIQDTQMYILTILMILDFVFWVARQYFLDKKSITSHNAWLGLFKKVSTLILVLVLAVMFKWINLDWRNYIEWVLWIFIMWEVYSILRSFYAIRTWEMLPEYDVISIGIKKIGEFIVWLVNRKWESLNK